MKSSKILKKILLIIFLVIGAILMKQSYVSAVSLGGLDSPTRIS